MCCSSDPFPPLPVTHTHSAKYDTSTTLSLCLSLSPLSSRLHSPSFSITVSSLDRPCWLRVLHANKSRTPLTYLPTFKSRNVQNVPLPHSSSTCSTSCNYGTSLQGDQGFSLLLFFPTPTYVYCLPTYLPTQELVMHSQMRTES